MPSGIIDWFSCVDWSPEAVTAAATVVLAVITFGLAACTLALWLATKRLVRDTEKQAIVAQRAYVKMSHMPPGLVFSNIRENNIVDKVSIRICVKNYGQTPAIVS